MNDMKKKIGLGFIAVIASVMVTALAQEEDTTVPEDPIDDPGRSGYPMDPPDPNAPDTGEEPLPPKEDAPEPESPE